MRRRRGSFSDSQRFRIRRTRIRRVDALLFILLLVFATTGKIIPDQEISIGPYEKLHIRSHMDFNSLPKEYIVTRFVYRNQTKPPTPICEYTLRNNKVMSNFIGFYPLLYENTFSFYHIKNFYYGNYYCYISEKGENYVVGNNRYREFTREIIAKVDHLVAGNSDTAENYGNVLIGTVSRLNQFPTYYLNISYIQVL